jgi:RNA polymerase sigma-B factor
VETAGGARPTDEQRDDEELARRFVDYRETGDRAIRDELIERHRWVAERCARRFTQRGEPYDDLLQVAMLGVFKAVERFDPDHGAPFVGFAMPTVLGELRRHFRDATWSVRVPRRAKDLHVRLPAAIEQLSQDLSRPPTPAELASELDATEEQVLEAIEAGAAYRSSSLDQLTASGVGGIAVDPASEITRADQRDQIARLLEGLPERERRIIYLRFYEELSQQEIADIVGTSQVHVSRLIRAAVAGMRSRADLGTDDDVEDQPEQ